MKNSPRDENALILGMISKEMPALADELVRAYDEQSLKTLVEAAMGNKKGDSLSADLTRVTDYLAKSVGLDKEDLTVAVVLSPAHSDAWDALVAIF